jgi:hypothetical protein
MASEEDYFDQETSRLVAGNASLGDFERFVSMVRTVTRDGDESTVPDYSTAMYHVLVNRYNLDRITDVVRIVQGDDTSDAMFGEVISYALDGFQDGDQDEASKNAILAIVRSMPPKAIKGLSQRHYKTSLVELFPDLAPLLMRNVSENTASRIQQNKEVIVARLRKNKDNVRTMKEVCRNDTNLLGESWGKIPAARRYGPLKDGYCYDITELAKVVLEAFKEGMWPSFPFTRKRVTYGDLDDIIRHLQQNAVPHTPTLPMIVFGLRNGYVKFGGTSRGDAYTNRLQFKDDITAYLRNADYEYAGDEPTA